MYKPFLSLIISFLPLLATAQNNWEVPDFNSPTLQTATQKKALKDDETIITIDGKEYVAKTNDLPYLKGAVPEVDGKVQYDLSFDCPGKSAAELYDKMVEILNELTHSELQSEKSKIALVDKENYSIVSKCYERMTFHESLLMSDRTTFTYTLMTNCQNDKVTLSFQRLGYDYYYGKKLEHIAANELITDALMLKKNGSQMKARNSKFRRKTVDRMMELKEFFENRLLK